MAYAPWIPFRAAQDRLDVGADIINVLCLRIGDFVDRIPAFLECLTAEERRKAHAYALQADCHRFAATRYFLRTLLAGILQCEAQDLSIAVSDRGKPFLHPAKQDIVFNVSHSGGYGAIAIGRRRAIGVDIEEIRHIANSAQIAASYLDGKVILNNGSVYFPKKLYNIPTEQIDFLRKWTISESILKCDAVGVAGLDRLQDYFSNNAYSYKEFALFNKCVGSIAFTHKNAQLKYFLIKN